MKTKTKLLGSDSTIEKLTQGIEKFYYTKIELTESGPNVWSVSNTKGTIEGVRVTKRGQRFRFEMILE